MLIAFANKVDYLHLMIFVNYIKFEKKKLILNITIICFYHDVLNKAVHISEMVFHFIPIVGTDAVWKIAGFNFI